uniref:Cytochrome b-245 heavy chain-like n=1 Tax=Petromyzon marinus TaxID=7757 RepID=A0AAJ7UC53_PETMA|nr:cytochrome b-245 heavy chain-like [Petromyzon marinus]
MQDALSWARASAACLNLNCTMVLLPTCRHLMSRVRAACWSPLRESLSGVPGASGMLMTTCLVLIATSSRESVRRANYEIFWFTHLLAPVLYAGLLVHGLGRVVRGQTEASLQEHNITWCYARHEQWGGREAACPTPQFSGNPPMTWRWLLLPLLLYAGEQLLRCYCCCHPTVVTKVTSFPLVPRAPALQKHSCHTSHDTPHVVPVRSAGGLYTHTLCCAGVRCEVREHPGHVLEVRVLGCPARARPGDHVLVRCASVSRAQWHALTLTWQNPPRTQMPIPVLGCQPWAGWPTVITAAHGLSAWWDSCHARRLTPCTPHPAWPRLCVDGPFVGPSRDVDRYPVSVLIAAGIGITPFAAYLGSWLTGAPRHTTVVARSFKRGSLCPIQVYLYWICREPSSFAWLCEPLRSLERHLMETGSSHQLRYKLYLTRWDETQAVHIALHWDEAEDTITGLRQKTWFGRPNWSVELDQIARAHPGVEVGVFACGPRSLCEGVRRRCSRYCSAGPDGAAFRFHQEAD